jgi:hypothetical protein
MDLLRTAVVDITTLVATCHALKSVPVDGDLGMHRKLRNRVQREIKRGTVAYIDALARTKLGVVDRALLVACRVAAERQMPRAISKQELLGRIMGSEAGSLDGLAAARQDLWRLAHMAIYLRIGIATLTESGDSVDCKAVRSLAARLRRRIRKALVAYARVSLSTKERKGQSIAAAREAALAEIGKRGAAEAERLSAIESGGDPAHTVIGSGVTKPLFDLAVDWQRHVIAQ